MGQAARIAVYVQNRTPHKVLENMTPEEVPIKIGYVWKHVFLHPFVLSVVKEIEFWACKLSKALLSMANEQLLRSPKPPKDLFLQNLIIVLINLL